jgi:cytochrome oxidase Cu insertion factor (SCO1/SenC/PrrC family)
VRRALVLAALLAFAAGTATAATAADTPPLAVGAAAPDTALSDQHGRPVRLTDLLKQRDFVVVAFYVKAFTGG